MASLQAKLYAACKATAKEIAERDPEMGRFALRKIQHCSASSPLKVLIQVGRDLERMASKLESVTESVTHTGVIVALPIPHRAMKAAFPQWRLNPDVGEPHVTLAYMGDCSEFENGPDSLLEAVRRWARKQQPVSGSINGFARFCGAGEKDAAVLLFDSPALTGARQDLVTELSNQADIHVSADHGFTPHITVFYMDKGEKLLGRSVGAVPVKIDVVQVFWGDTVLDFPLGGSGTEPVQEAWVQGRGQGNLKNLDTWVLKKGKYKAMLVKKKGENRWKIAIGMPNGLWEWQAHTFSDAQGPRAAQIQAERMLNWHYSEIIRKDGTKWVLWSKDGTKKLGTYDSKEDAEERERQIQAFKHAESEFEEDPMEAPSGVRRRDMSRSIRGEKHPMLQDDEEIEETTSMRWSKLSKARREARLAREAGNSELQRVAYDLRTLYDEDSVRDDPWVLNNLKQAAYSIEYGYVQAAVRILNEVLQGKKQQLTMPVTRKIKAAVKKAQKAG